MIDQVKSRHKDMQSINLMNQIDLEHPDPQKLIFLMSIIILDLVYTSRDLYISDKVRFRPTRPTYLLSGLSTTSLHTRVICHLVNILIDKAYVYIKEKF